MLIFLIIVAVIAIYLVMAYNGLVRLKNEIDNAWKQIDVQLKRRHDLIPNLVEAVKGYMQFERDTLTQVVEARDRGLPAFAETCPQYLFCSDDESTHDPAGRDFDEALEQIASERCCVCPLCGAIVASDGSVVS